MQDYARAAIEADRQRRGEPVAWRWKWKDLPNAGWQLSSVGGWRETDAIKAEPLYLAPIAPQPALDAADLAFIADELRQAGKNRAADLVLTAMAYPTQPAEPVKVPSDADIDELSREWGLQSAAYPSKSMVRDFAHALLARYGQDTQPADPVAPSEDEGEGMSRYVKVNGKWVRCTILKNGARLISAPVDDD